jgi:hypothetical protein
MPEMNIFLLLSQPVVSAASINAPKKFSGKKNLPIRREEISRTG